MIYEYIRVTFFALLLVDRLKSDHELRFPLMLNDCNQTALIVSIIAMINCLMHRLY